MKFKDMLLGETNSKVNESPEWGLTNSGKTKGEIKKINSDIRNKIWDEKNRLFFDIRNYIKDMDMSRANRDNLIKVTNELSFVFEFLYRDFYEYKGFDTALHKAGKKLRNIIDNLKKEGSQENEYPEIIPGTENK